MTLRRWPDARDIEWAWTLYFKMATSIAITTLLSIWGLTSMVIYLAFGSKSMSIFTMEFLLANELPIPPTEPSFANELSIPPAMMTQRPHYADLFSAVCSFDHPADHLSGKFVGDAFWEKYAFTHALTRARIVAKSTNYGKILLWHCFDGAECGGVGDQGRGLATALYLAMLTGRALFLQWTRHGQDITSLFKQHGINWRLPSSFKSNCSSYTFWEGKVVDFAQRAQSSEPCLSVGSNAVPEHGISVLGPEVCKVLPKNLRDELQYSVGCAMNFLFSFSNAYKELVGNARLLLPASVQGGNSHPAWWRASRYVAVHLRFMDASFVGEDTPSESIVRDALNCAENAGQELFGAGEDWGIFFASDSAAARKYALARSVGSPIFISKVKPAHSDLVEERNPETLWASWSDQLLLTWARGIIQCRDEIRHCRESGYSQLAMQRALMPIENVWVLTANGCIRGGDITMDTDYGRTQRHQSCTNYVSQQKEELAKFHIMPPS